MNGYCRTVKSCCHGVFCSHFSVVLSLTQVNLSSTWVKGSLTDARFSKYLQINMREMSICSCNCFSWASLSNTAAVRGGFLVPGWSVGLHRAPPVKGRIEVNGAVTRWQTEGQTVDQAHWKRPRINVPMYQIRSSHISKPRFWAYLLILNPEMIQNTLQITKAPCLLQISGLWSDGGKFKIKFKAAYCRKKIIQDESPCKRRRNENSYLCSVSSPVFDRGYWRCSWPSIKTLQHQ